MLTPRFRATLPIKAIDSNSIGCLTRARDNVQDVRLTLLPIKTIDSTTSGA